MIRITLRGDANSIYAIQEEDIQAYVDVSKFSAPGNYQPTVQIRKRGMALEISPLEVRMEPGEIPLSLDHKISKFVPIKVNLQGEVEAGYLLDSYNFSPRQVIVDGPSAHLNNIKELNTELVDLSRRSDDFTVTVNILNQDPLITIRGRGVTEFSGFISRVVSVRNIQNVPIRITGLDGLFSGEPESWTVNLRLEGRNQEVLDSFDLPEDFLFVDCSTIQEPGTYILNIQGEIPSSLVLAIDPPEMKINIFLAEAQLSELSGAQLLEDQ
jgi:YbbR domain-containing protein